MRGSINGLKCRLKRDAPLMYNLFEILEKKRGLGVKPTPEELLVASGQRTVDQLPYQLQEQLKQIGDLSETTQSKPVSRLGPEQKWIVACDQPFDEVEKFEFKQMIHAINPNAVLPSADTVQRRVVDMANEMVTGLKTMISGLDSKKKS
ncbi:hypothetical protein BJV78DRAFT_21670 [Lactifluus subvellereus]|nr:hypothetical protein BJV78DRAFT_21670 [Lactifluus subvellereus]